jgi:hypothetical protein
MSTSFSSARTARIVTPPSWLSGLPAEPVRADRDQVVLPAGRARQLLVLVLVLRDEAAVLGHAHIAAHDVAPPSYLSAMFGSKPIRLGSRPAPRLPSLAIS